MTSSTTIRLHLSLNHNIPGKQFCQMSPNCLTRNMQTLETYYMQGKKDGQPFRKDVASRTTNIVIVGEAQDLSTMTDKVSFREHLMHVIDMLEERTYSLGVLRRVFRNAKGRHTKSTFVFMDQSSANSLNSRINRMCYAMTRNDFKSNAVSVKGEKDVSGMPEEDHCRSTITSCCL